MMFGERDKSGVEMLELSVKRLWDDMIFRRNLERVRKSKVSMVP